MVVDRVVPALGSKGRVFGVCEKDDRDLEGKLPKPPLRGWQTLKPNYFGSLFASVPLRWPDHQGRPSS